MKIIKVESCWGCSSGHDYQWPDGSVTHECTKFGRCILNDHDSGPTPIPDWCQLPDEEKNWAKIREYLSLPTTLFESPETLQHLWDMVREMMEKEKGARP